MLATSSPKSKFAINYHEIVLESTVKRQHRFFCRNITGDVFSKHSSKNTTKGPNREYKDIKHTFNVFKGFQRPISYRISLAYALNSRHESTENYLKSRSKFLSSKNCIISILPEMDGEFLHQLLAARERDQGAGFPPFLGLHADLPLVLI